MAKIEGKKFRMIIASRVVRKIVILDLDDILNPRKMFIETVEPVEIKGMGSWKIEFTMKEREKK